MQLDIHSSTELSDVAKLFYGDDFPNIFLAQDGQTFDVYVGENSYHFEYTDGVYSIMPQDHADKRLAKIAVYDALVDYTGRIMPWGALTGVRPTKLFYECMGLGYSVDESKSLMQKIYRVSEARADVLKKIILSQSGNVRFAPEYINLYVHIPYCTTRCSYCSFVSMPIDKCKKQSEDYVLRLCDEIKASLDLLKNHGKKILSVYIGGGTPTAIDDHLFDMLLSALGNFDCEYTCEAGRPDTVTAEKCNIMRAHGVTRVCVNPQTLNEKTLELIGRRHSVQQFFDAYEAVKNRGFDINCDLIAGLPEETADDFVTSFEAIRALKPDNITVHSLSKKNGSALRYSDRSNKQTYAMLDYALSNMGEYAPYYLYRQKRQECNLENVGLSLPNKTCVNNITTMEETVSVMACGAGAISKVIGNGTITRFANMRDVGQYISRYDERLKAKLNYFSSQFK